MIDSYFYLKQIQRLAVQQYSHNIWTNNLQQDITEQRNIFITSGNLRWSSADLAIQAQYMFKIIVLVAVAGVANRSLLLNTEYSGIPAKKLHQFLVEYS